MKPMLSIIVTIYNIEKYIEDCIKSIISQDLSEVEVLLVSDGSKDSSDEICQRYADEVEQITYVRKENGGISDARNFGLLEAKGEYVFFVDGDDALNEGAIETILSIIHSSEPCIIVGNTYRRIEGTTEIKEYSTHLEAEKINQKSGRDTLLYLFNEVNDVMYEAWKYIIKRSYLLEQQIFFEKGRVCEDLLWVPEMLLKGGTTMMLPQPHYIYTEARPGSIMNSYNVKRDMDLAYVIKTWLDKARELEDEEIKHAIQARMVRIAYLDLYPNAFEYDVIDRDKIEHSLTLTKEELAACSDQRVKILRVIHKVLGTTVMFKLVHLYKYRGKR